jgi:serine/threonine-protein kinase RsbW
VAPTTVALEIPPRPDWFALVRRVVGSAASLAADLPDRRVDDLRLAVSEACANAVDGQRAAGSDLPILVTVALEATAVTVTVTDHGGGFDPGEVDPLPAAEDPTRLRHERGLGLPLMRDLADQVTFTRTGDGTAVELVVALPG